MSHAILGKHRKITKIKFGTLIAFITVFVSTGIVTAEELVITGNGSGSSNNATSTNTQTANVSQSNNLDVNNNIETDSNTGNNDTSGNVGGESIIDTGDTSTEVIVTNTGNSSSSDLSCCNGSSTGTVDISGNGTGSYNGVNVNNTSTTNINHINTASIINNITGYANTGNNSANHNTSGNVYIKTGSISVSEKITNGPLNFNDSSSAIGPLTPKDYKLVISGNGSFSSNFINLDLNNTTNINTYNTLDILNESIWLLNTGHNKAKDNINGNVSILTGDISFIASILNGPINVNKVEVKCCKEVEEPTGGVTPVAPPTAAKVESNPSETKSSDGSKGGEVLSAKVENILPVTGNYLFLLLMIGNVAMFLLGMVLRLRSGRSPGLSGVVV